MLSIEARCCICGDEHQSSIPRHESKHGSGSAYGTERLDCPECGEETLHNRSGKSTPSEGAR